MKKIYPLILALGGMLGTSYAQSPVKLSRDTATAYRIAANGSTVIWFDRKSGTDHVYVSYNKQKALTSVYAAAQGIDALVTGDKFAGFAADYKMYATSNGSTFQNALVDTALMSPFNAIETHDDKLFAIQPGTNANFTLYEKTSVAGDATLITSKARAYTQSKGYIGWWQVDDTIAFRKPGGETKYIVQVQDVRAMAGNGNKLVWVKDGSPMTVQYTVDGENQQTVTSLKGANARLVFLGSDKLVIQDDSLYVYQLSPTIQKIRTYGSLAILASRGNGVILTGSSLTIPYLLTNAGDTFNLSTIPGYNAFALMDICGENLCVVTRPTNFVSVIKWYKDGVFQKDILPQTENATVNDKGFFVSERSVAWAQNIFTGDRSKGGIYLYEFDGPVSGIMEQGGEKMIRMSLYPNPVNDRFTLSNPVTGRVNIYTIQGVLVRSEQYAGEVLVNDLKPGIYVVRAETKEGTGYCRFVKQ